MSMNPLAPVIDYQSMLNRICCVVAVGTLAAVWILRTNLPALDDAWGPAEAQWQDGAGGVLPLPLGYLLPAIVIGLVSRVFRVHRRVSAWLGISEHFDIEVILSELATGVGVDTRRIDAAQWTSRRRALMRNAFYRFVGGASPQIDHHLVHQSRDVWSWFWTGVETTLLFVLTSLVLVAGGAYAAGFMTLGATLAIAGFALPAIRGQCRRYAIAQVNAILADPVRRRRVNLEFDWAPRVRQNVAKSA